MSLPPHFCDRCGINVWENPGVVPLWCRDPQTAAPATVRVTCDCGALATLSVDLQAYRAWQLTAFDRLAQAGAAQAQAFAASLDPLFQMSGALSKVVEEILTASQVPVVKTPTGRRGIVVTTGS